MNDPVAALIARLLAERWLPREDELARQALTDAGFREELDRRLAAAGLRLLDHPYAGHVAVAIAKAQEAAVFAGPRAWSASNLDFDRDCIALLVVLWSLLILPKRPRQIRRVDADREQEQGQIFAEMKPVPVGSDVAEPLAERTLIADFGDKLGGKMRININLGVLARHGFIVRRKERIIEGPLLDLAFDYERTARRVLDGALAFVVERAHGETAADAVDETDTEFGHV